MSVFNGLGTAFLFFNLSTASSTSLALSAMKSIIIMPLIYLGVSS